jgi:hypothetical protein
MDEEVYTWRAGLKGRYPPPHKKKLLLNICLRKQSYFSLISKMIFFAYPIYLLLGNIQLLF